MLQGFPGRVQVRVTYTLTEANELITEMHAVTGTDSIVSPCLLLLPVLEGGAQLNGAEKWGRVWTAKTAMRTCKELLLSGWQDVLSSCSLDWLAGWLAGWLAKCLPLPSPSPAYCHPATLPTRCPMVCV